MKRLIYSAGFAFLLTFFSCAQHNSEKPDTSGAVPYNQPGVGVDTTSAQTKTQTTTGPTNANSSNDYSNNNKQVNTGDSSQKKH